MRNIRRLILTSIAAVAFVGMTVAISHADCIDCSGSRGQGTGGFTGSQNPCYQGSSLSGQQQQLGAGAGAQVGPVGAGVGAGAGGGQIGAGTGAQVGNEQLGAGVGAGTGGQTGYSQGNSYYQGGQSSSYYQSGQATGGYTGAQCDNIGTPCYKSGPVWSSDGSVGAGTGGPTEYRQFSQNYPGPDQNAQLRSAQQSSQFQSGQAAGGYQGQSVTTPCCVQCAPGMTSGSSVGAGPGGPAAYQQAYRNSQYAGGQQQNFNQNPCFTGGAVGTGTGGYTGYQQNYQQTPQSYQQSGYQQNYQSGTSFQGQGAGGTQSPCYSQTPCCQGNTMGTGTGGMTGTTNMQSGPQQGQQGTMQQNNMGPGMTGAGTGGPCTYTFGSGAGGSTGRDFYGTGFHSWIERW